MKAPYIPFLLAYFALGKPSCRCLYGNACWPSESDFERLGSQLSQPLLRPSPPESACYPVANPSGDCTEVVANTNSGHWRSDQPGSMQSPNFETYIFGNGTISACYLNTTLGLPCGQGSVPVIGVDARSVNDVQTTVRFAAKHNLRLVIKNTGHDYLGRSTARGSLLLWTHHLKNITYEETFVPDGAPPGENHKAITLGAGVQWNEAYDAVEAKGRFILGGISLGGSVGAAGGWVQGGGHSAFAARHGLGVDNVIQFTVVTASGEYLTANNYKNSDLFWALRGGGGGTYGIAISTTYATHDPFPLSAIGFQANFSSPEIAKTVLTEYVKLHPNLSDAGWGGYSFLSANSLSFFYVAPNISPATANATLDPFVRRAQNTTGGLAGAFTIPYESFYAWYKATFAAEGQVGTNVEIASRLLPRDMAENHAAEVADVLLALEGGVAINFVTGGLVSKIDPATTGLHPAWRKAIAHIYCTAGWPEGVSVSDIRQARQGLRSKLAILDRLAPGSASYFNEGTLYEKDFKKSFFGPHYNRLRSIKAKYDPDTLFIVASGVGSEDWDGELNCRRHK